MPASPLDPILDSTGQNLERYMDLLSARQRLVAANIANADTPGYTTQDLDFQSEMNAGLNSRWNAPLAVPVAGLKVKSDGNNVNLDREARLLAENALRFNLASALMREQIRAVRSAIQEGRSS